MKFLEDYRTLEAFKADNKGFDTLRETSNQAYFYGSSLKELLKTAGVDVTLGAAKASYSQLLTRYSEKEIFYGLMTLWNLGKGGNIYTQHRGTYIAKFSESDRKSAERNSGLFDKMDQSVALAKKLAKTAAEAFDSAVPAVVELLDAAMFTHFRITRKDPLWATVRQNFRNIRTFMDGVIRLASAKSRDVPPGAVGYVSFKAIDSSAIVSPYKTAGAPPGATSEGSTHGGSIHIKFDVFWDTKWDVLGIAAVIVHEASHKICATEDHAYVSDGVKYWNLPAQLRVENADCYGYLAASMVAGRALKKKTNTLSLD